MYQLLNVCDLMVSDMVFDTPYDCLVVEVSKDEYIIGTDITTASVMAKRGSFSGVVEYKYAVTTYSKYHGFKTTTYGTNDMVLARRNEATRKLPITLTDKERYADWSSGLYGNLKGMVEKLFVVTWLSQINPDKFHQSLMEMIDNKMTSSSATDLSYLKRMMLVAIAMNAIYEPSQPKHLLPVTSMAMKMIATSEVSLAWLVGQYDVSMSHVAQVVDGYLHDIGYTYSFYPSMVTATEPAVIEGLRMLAIFAEVCKGQVVHEWTWLFQVKFFDLDRFIMTGVNTIMKARKMVAHDGKREERRVNDSLYVLDV